MRKLNGLNTLPPKPSKGAIARSSFRLPAFVVKRSRLQFKIAHLCVLMVAVAISSMFYVEFGEDFYDVVTTEVPERPPVVTEENVDGFAIAVFSIVAIIGLVGMAILDGFRLAIPGAVAVFVLLLLLAVLGVCMVAGLLTPAELPKFDPIRSR